MSLMLCLYIIYSHLTGICKNLANFAHAGVGTQRITWENVAVVIVSDGRMKASKSGE
jgi:hypothetical protein